MQLNDHARGRFTTELISFLENTAEQITIALAQRQTQAALLASEERYRRLFEVESDAIVLVDPTTERFIEVNGAALMLYGYTREEFLFMKADDVSAEPEKTYQAISTGQLRIPLRWHKKKDGTVFPVEIAGSYFDYHGRKIHVAAIRDISERKRAEEILGESEHKYHSLFENSMDAVFLTVPNGKVIAANRAACAMFGMTEEELCRVGREGISDTSDPRYAAALKERAREGNIQCELTYIRKDGTKFPADVNSVILEGGLRSFVILRDITVRKQAEETMLRSALFHRSSLDAMGSHIAILNETGCIISVNKAWRAFAEANGGDLRRVCEGANYLKTCDQAIGEDSEQARSVAKGIRLVLSGTQEFYGTEYSCHSPNEKRWFSMQVSRFSEDHLPRVVVIHETITERKHAEVVLRQRETELAHLSRVHVVGEMAAVLAHELNQPLYSINNYVGGIECRLRQLGVLPGSEDLVTAVKCVSDEVNRAAAIIRRLREFVRGREPHRSSVDILQSIRHVTELMGSSARGKGVSLTTSTSKDIPSVLADPIQIEQVIVNFVANAIDAVAGFA